mmetsp:Transcript_26379/g.67068  ORF Transcript_26379/g.67068 Transcript_26379/m.67068 type:complete len:215 (-) Transcript_26379:592-1236(-)
MTICDWSIPAHISSSMSPSSISSSNHVTMPLAFRYLLSLATRPWFGRPFSSSPHSCVRKTWYSMPSLRGTSTGSSNSALDMRSIDIFALLPISPTFPLRSSARESCQEGWQYMLNSMLEICLSLSISMSFLIFSISSSVSVRSNRWIAALNMRHSVTSGSPNLCQKLLASGSVIASAGPSATGCCCCPWALRALIISWCIIRISTVCLLSPSPM